MPLITVIGTLLKIAAAYLVVSTAEGRKQIPYKEINVLYDGMTLDELIRKRVKVIIWEDGTMIEVSRPNE